MLREGKGMGNLRLVIPGIPGNHIKAKVKFNILFILCLDQPSAKLQIIIVFPVLIHGQNKTGIPAHPWSKLSVSYLPTSTISYQWKPDETENEMES